MPPRAQTNCRDRRIFNAPSRSISSASSRGSSSSPTLEKRPTRDGETRWRVKYRIGGRESIPKGAGTFKTQRDALARRGWVLGELAAMRVPDVRLVSAPAAVTLSDLADRWLRSRVDVSDGTL